MTSSRRVPVAEIGQDERPEIMPADMPPVPTISALVCGDEHWITGATCTVVGPHNLHTYDGLGDWAEPATDSEETE